MKKTVSILLLTLCAICAYAAEIQNDTICHGDSLLFHGRYYCVAGTYPHSERVIDHIDTIYAQPDTTVIELANPTIIRIDTFFRDSVTDILILTVLPTHLQNVYVNACTGDTVVINGKAYTKSAIAYDTLTSIGGCDSVIRSIINFHTKYLVRKAASICEGNSYPFAGRKLTQTGIYYDSLTTVNGCDSIISIALTVNSRFQQDDYDTICNGMTYYWHGNTYTSAGTYKIAGKTADGCDSIYVLHLTLRQDVIQNIFDTICNGETYTFHGKAYRKQGTYTDTIHAIDACDTICHINLRVKNHPIISRNVTICSNEFFEWAGKSYYKPGTYRDTLPGRGNECDTFSTIRLSVLPIADTVIHKNFCKGSYFMFNNKTINKAGTYIDTLVASNGCDSIIHLIVNENPSYLIKDTIQICQGDSNIFFGQVLKQSGTYSTHLTSVLGCDSIYQRTLIVNPTTSETINIHRCDRMAYNFHGRQITTPGTYRDTIRNSNGCDSIVILNYDTTVYNYYETARICEGETFNFHGTLVSTPGHHHVTFPGIYNCDSNYHLQLTVGRRYEFITDTTVCQGTNFLWRGKQYVTSGTYHDRLATTLGCDSIYTLRITFIPTKHTTKTITFCHGDSLYFNGKVIKSSVNIDDTLRAYSGCDSIVHYRFNMLPSFHHSDTVDICIGSNYIWHGQTIRRSGVYWDSLKTVNGCDSIFELTVRGVSAQFTTIDATICNNEYYLLNGKRYNVTGTYYDTVYNAQGCADIFVLNLTVNPTYIFTDFVTLCSDQGFWYKGVFIDHPGIFYDTLKNTLGCDSIRRIVANREPSYFFSDTARIYKGASYNFRGTTLTIGGTYYDSLKTINGCDSIFQLILQVTPEFHQIDHETICDNEYYNFNGRLINKTGIYFDSLKTFNNLDSVYELHLTVYPTYFSSSEVTECHGKSMYFRGRHITEPGIYFDSLYTQNGCDSVFRLVFNWSNTYLFEDTAVICNGDFHHFRGRDLRHAGIYFDSLLTTNGCDSIYKLTLIVKNHFYSELVDTLCEGDVYDFHGRKLTEEGVYYDSVTTAQGCDSVFKLTLHKFPSYEFTTVINRCQGEQFVYRGRLITQPGVYYDSLYSSSGCDSVYRLVFSWQPEYHFYDTVNICLGDYYTFRGRNINKTGTYYDSLITKDGCDSIYELYLNVVKQFHDVQTVRICSNEYYNFRGTSLNESGIYFDSLKNSYGCDSVYELRLTILPHYLLTEYIEMCHGGTYQFKGRTITQQGTYYDSLKTQQGCDSITQLIVNFSPRYLFVDTASICSESSFVWRGNVYNHAGTYYDSLLTRRGCDSIYKLVLYVIQPFHSIEYVNICSNEFYNFHGRYLDKTGVYFDSIKGFQGCDSIYELHLQINPIYIIDKYVDVCYGNSITFRGKQITKPGIYYDSLYTHQGCDSVYRLIFSWNSKYLFSDTARICTGGYYNFRGRIVTKPGLYYDSLTSIDGCDSIYRLVLYVESVHHITIDTTICSNQFFAIHGTQITESGTYYDTMKTIYGCDSFITYNLTVLPSYLDETFITLCYGSDLFFRGIHITEPGIYYDSMLTTHGCDSVFKMIFNWTPAYLIVDTIVLCDGSTYNFHGRTINNPGIYFDSLLTTAGCDSVYKLVVFTGNGTYDEKHINLCTNEQYFFHGKRITQSGIYFDTLTTTLGCDSVTKYVFTVDSAKNTTININICSNDVYYRSDGTTINKTGIYTDSMFTSTGCDSVVKIVLNVHADQVFETVDTMRHGTTYNWRGRRLTSSGVYWDSLVSAHGCDSIFKLRLTKMTYYTEIDTTICNDTYLRFNNKNYTETGIYYDTLQTIHNCDSIFKIDLTVNTAYNIVRYMTICDSDYPIPFAGGFVNQTGVYTDSTVTVHGCDSINVLYLTVVQTYFFTEDTICEDEIYSWRGKQYTQPGLYADTVLDQTEAHCDIIFALRLHTVQKTNLYGTDMAPFICADDLEYSIVPRYTGTKPDLYTIRYTSAEIGKASDIVNADFKTSPIIVPLPLSVDGDSLRPDTYTGTLELFNSTCDANPMSLDFTLNIRYPSYIVEQHWNDVVAILNSKYNGGYSFSKYEWFVNDILIQSITGSNMFLPNLRTGDKIEVALTREGEGYSVMTCPIWMQDLNYMEVSEYPVAIEGTILRGTNSQARIIASAAGTYALYTATGTLVSSGSFSADSETMVTLPSVSGIYFLKVVSNDEPRTFKLMVQ